jgi:hypothetical protein
MNKLMSFVRLDFVTVKPYFTAKNLLIYAGVALFLTVMSDNISAGISVGLMLGTMFVGYPFALGEKSNMDALYTTLSVSRKNVVTGRYLFVFALDLCGVLIAFALSTFGLLTVRMFGYKNGAVDTLPTILMLSALFIIIQAIQLPFFFKLGYAKAKIFSIVPFAAIMAAYAALLGASNKSNAIWEFFVSLMANIGGNNMLLAIVSIAAICLIVYASYELSLVLYKKREF